MLRPCPGCRRHVADEPTCRFCACALPPIETPRAIVLGRFSRAAVFTGAALAGCWTGHDTPTTDHRDTPIARHHDDPTVVHTRGEIEGVVTDRNSGAPIAGTPIDLRSRATGQTRTAVTDASGHYVFTDVDPGEYEIITMRSGNPRRPPQTGSITVGEGAKLHRDLTIFIPQASNIPMPYGAPPARRRFV